MVVNKFSVVFAAVCVASGGAFAQFGIHSVIPLQLTNTDSIGQVESGLDNACA